MAKFIVPGLLDVAPAAPVIASHVREIKPRQSVTLDVTRSAQKPAELEDAECIELELSGGVRLWMRSDDLERDLGATADRAGGGIVLPRVLPVGRRSRGGEAEIVINTLKTFDIDIPGTVADFIAGRVERGLDAGGQLLQCSPANAAAFSVPTKLDGRGATLLFLHGTASSTEGSFGGLWEGVGSNRLLRIENPGARVNDLFERYGGRVLALQHRTLTESPIQNAEALVQQLARVLPAEAELHLVSHSRGGLIGELLCRGMRTEGAPFDALDLKAFEPRAKEQERLETISRILTEQQYRITRFIRVACPAAGTTLADGRLDRYVSMLVNIVGKLTTLAANPVYEALTSLLAAVLKQRTDPASLPGLEAMMPVSPLAKVLNRRDVISRADLHVLGGDLSITGLFSALKALATDFYYMQDHDLVVNTRSMLRGVPRAAGVKYWIDTGGEVSHFNYFARADTASRLCDALFGKEEADGFHPLKVPPFEVGKDSYRKRAAAQMPVLFVIPGFMGSHLSVSGRVWVDPTQLATGRFGLLADGAIAVPESLAGAYAPLVEHLAASHEVVPFAYDWRLSAERNAGVLRTAIEEKFEIARAANQPIRLLAHSSGGVLVQALLASEEGAGTWRRVCEQHPGARAVLLGLPAGGSHRVAAMLTTRSRVVQGLAALDVTRTAAEIQGILAGFDGLLELLPESDDDGHDWFDRSTWERLNRADAAMGAPWRVPEAARLRAAAEVRARLRQARLDPARIVYVAGMADETPSAFRIDDGAARPVLLGTPEGDGHVTWASGIPESLRARTYYAAVDHGALAMSSDLFPAIADLLAAGSTSRLRTAAPVQARGVAASKPMTVRAIEMIPDEGELVASALGSEVRSNAPPPAQRVRVRVVHGNLSRATSPILIGHYEQDVFVSAEDYLDRQLDGWLRELHRMRLYPGAIGTSAVAVNHLDERIAGVHPGAIVVGLGVVGELTPGSLIATLEQGLTAYGAELTAHRRRQGRGKSDVEASASVPAPVTALLVGSSEGGVSLRDSVNALLRAVKRANQRLAAGEHDRASDDRRRPAVTAFIDKIDLLELFEDRAIEASRILNVIADSAEFKEAFVAERFVARGAEGRQRAAFDAQMGWWQRLRITEQDASVDPEKPTGTRLLKYEALTERARIEAFAVKGQRQLADAFIDDAMATTASDANIGRTLFEMLVPLPLKERAPDRRDTVLLLDAAAAAIPWELFEDAFDQDTRPTSVESGMIRQLVEHHSRERVLQATERTALVIGDPVVADPRFPALAGAADEAVTTATRLQVEGYEVLELIGNRAAPTAILKALHQRSWRILHLATHGVFKFAPTENAELVTGAVIGNGVFLQPQDFNQMRYVPELVFLNCCHVGNTGEDAKRETPRYPELAAGLATQFIKMGARAVIAAGWAVDDGAAQLFADVFYSQILRGATFGEATHRARAQVYQRFPTRNTWGAYQCYGDPAFSLRAASSDGGDWPLVWERELWLQADSIANQAKTADRGQAEKLRQRLDALIDAADTRWLEDARACAALGAAFGELQRFETAISYYKKARNTERADVSVSALEQLANLQGRYAEHLWRDRKADDQELRRKVAELFDDSEKLLRTLVDVAPTSERYSFLGGLHKRQVMAAPSDEELSTALQHMIGAYRSAYHRKVDTRQSDPWYPLMNAAAAQLALEWCRGTARPGKGRKQLLDDLGELQRLANVLQQGATNFWELSFLADLELLKALARRTLSDDALQSLQEAYDRARRRGASAREFDSVVSQIRFLNAMAERSPDAALNGAVAQRLNHLVILLRQDA